MSKYRADSWIPKPASVTNALRFVRCHKRTPSRSSNCRTEWLSARA
jgi:hypothetical protein